MPSESARMNSAAEARFRIQAPNSTPRSVRVLALDPRSEPIVERLAQAGWNSAAFFTAAPAADGHSGDLLRTLEGRPHDLAEAITGADLVVMVAAAGARAPAASDIGRACSARRIMTTALVVGASDASDAALSATLAQVRPWSLMVVIANDDSYIEDMLRALRA